MADLMGAPDGGADDDLEPLTVLMADDSASSRVVLQHALESLGHRPLVAKDGEEAWELFQKRRPPMVISDWVMPGVDGLELCRRIRSDGSGSHTYFVMLTGLDDREQALEGMRAGADDYLAKPLDRHELETRLIAASRMTALHARLASEQDAVERLNTALRTEARIDHLTRCGNRLLMRENLAALAARVERYGHRTSLALFDIDYFKQLNDSAGHLAGDEILRSVSGELMRQARDGDAVYRYGGEEFLVVLAEQDVRGGVVAAERMRRAVEALGLAHPSDEAGPVVTVSAGVAAMEAGGTTDPEQAIGLADEALYRAKEGGRNRVEGEAGGS